MPHIKEDLDSGFWCFFYGSDVSLNSWKRRPYGIFQRLELR